MRKVKRSSSAQNSNRRPLLWRIPAGLFVFFRRSPRLFLLFFIFGALSFLVHLKVHLWLQEKANMITIDAVDKASAWAGLTVKDVYLEGRVYANREEIERAIELTPGQSILRIRLSQVRHRLEELPWVEKAVVERLLPSTLSVHVVEREPMALWQYQGKMHVIDREGNVIPENNLAPFSDRIILVGKDVPSFASNLFEMFAAEPELSARVSSAIRVGERRWNIRMHNGIEIRLPEEDQEKAWHFLSSMQAENAILDAPVRTIDLRITDKVYITKAGKKL